MPQHFGPLVFVIVNFVVWTIALVRRWPYMNQIPVHDLDVTTSVATMWARSWYWEGPFHLGLALTYAPLSVETPTLTSRHIYESWPPGLVVPIYLSAVALGEEPSIAMVNWINVIGQGLSSLLLSTAAYALCRYAGWSRAHSGLLASTVPFLALTQRGPLYFFSQIYSMDPHVLVFVSAFIFFEAWYQYASSARTQRVISVVLLAIAFWGCLVDWLMYFVIAVWLIGRFVGQRRRLMPAMSLRHWVGAVALPFVTFGIFLAWRFSLEGSLATTAGLRAAIADVVWKATYRAGLQDDYPLPVPFADRLWWMHEYYFSPITPWVLTLTAAAFVVLVGINFAVRRSTFPAIARPLFATLLVSGLVTLPVYAQMWTFRQHTVIHPFSSAKLLMPYAFLPFVALPLLAGFIIDRLVTGRARSVARGVMVAVALAGAVDAGRRYDRPYLIGRIDPARMAMWETIRRNVSYRDVVFSPDLEAPPFKVAMGVANKIVYAATTFADVDPVVDHVCGPFNIVVVFTGDRKEPAWDGRIPTTVVRDGGLTFFRFVDQQGPARECP